MDDQLINFEILKAVDATLWREYQEERFKWEKQPRKYELPKVPTCDDLFELANEWKSFINSGDKPNQIGFSNTSFT